MTGPVQRYADVVISGVAHVDAPHPVSSAWIDAQLSDTMQRLGMQPGLLEHVAGIVERRFWDPGTQPSSVATLAARRVLDAGPVDDRDVGLLVNTSVDRDYLEPSVASIVHANLGLPATALNFDLGNACLGFMNGMNLVAGMIERREIDHGLVVDGEGSRRVVESTIARLADPACDGETFRESFATLTLGSGAAAMLLSRADLVPDGHPYLGGLSRAATEHNRLCRGQADDMRTDARALLLAAMAHAKEVYPEAVETFGLTDETVDRYVIHQVSRVHTTTLVDLLGLDPAKMPLIFPHYGNIGPAGMIITLSKEAEAGGLRRGDRIVMMGIGSGINASVAELIW